MLSQVQDAILAAAAEALPGLVQVESYAGQFSADGPDHGRVTAPALFLAALDASLAEHQTGDGRLALDVRWAAYCLARNAKGAAYRGRDAMSMAAAFAQTVHHSQWGLAPSVQHARLESVQNLYSSHIDNKGFALWVVQWRQVVLLGDNIWEGGDTPAEIWAGWSPTEFPADYTQQEVTP